MIHPKEGWDTDAKTVTIQTTSKSLKLQSVLSLLLMLIGAIWLILAPGVVPALVTIAGATWKVVNRVQIWWRHK